MTRRIAPEGSRCDGEQLDLVSESLSWEEWFRTLLDTAAGSSAGGADGWAGSGPQARPTIGDAALDVPGPASPANRWGVEGSRGQPFQPTTQQENSVR